MSLFASSISTDVTYGSGITFENEANSEVMEDPNANQIPKASYVEPPPRTLPPISTTSAVGASTSYVPVAIATSDVRHQTTMTLPPIKSAEPQVNMCV